MLSDNTPLRKLTIEDHMRIIMKEDDLDIRISLLENLKHTMSKQSFPYINFLIRKYRAKIIERSDLPF